MRIDLHLHSKYSDQPVHWAAGDYPESLSEVRDLYKSAIQKGMDFVTLTDHNVIGGALELVERYPEKSFISCEFDVTFPEDGCNVHIPVYNLTEAQYDDINRMRGNIYDVRAYLNENDLAHTVAHAFYSVNGKLTLDHIEKLLLMFKTFEINGSRSQRLNDTLQNMLESLTPAQMQNLANKHDIAPCTEPWRKFLTAGSDDHSGLKVAQKYTQIEGAAKTLPDFLDAVFKRGMGQPMGRCSGPESLAHSIHSIAYQQMKKDFKFKRLLSGNEAIRTINRLLSGEKLQPLLLTRLVGNLLVAVSKGKVAGTLLDLLNHAIKSNPDILSRTDKSADPERAWFNLMEVVLSQGAKDIFEEGEALVRAKNYAGLWPLAGRAMGLSAASSPYFISYHVTNRDEQFGTLASNRILGKPDHGEGCARIVSFTDTFDEMNGVAVTLKQQLEAARKLGLAYSVLTCSPAPDTQNYNEIRFKPVTSKAIPQYPELSVHVPPFLQILDYCYRYNPTHIVAETEGLMGLSALAVGYLLNKPVYSVYHTQFPQFAGAITGRPQMEELTWEYMRFFHNRTCATFAPSEYVRKDLLAAGFDPQNVRVYPRGVDVDRFRKMTRSSDASDNATRFIYVGRLSKEKGLDVLANAYRTLSAQGRVELDIVGDGPYKQDLQSLLAGTNVRFRGYLNGEALIQAYNDADCFVMPSATDTWGNVVLEAQACGLPCIVSDKGGPQENILPLQTGFVCKAGNAESFARAMTGLLSRDIQKAMAAKAETYAKGRSFEEAYQNFWKMIRDGDPEAPANNNRRSDMDLLKSMMRATGAKLCP